MHDAFLVSISDDECSSIASSLYTEIYEEGDSHDIEKHEKETQEPLVKKDVVNLAASADVRFQFPGQVRKDNTEEMTTQDLLLSVNKCAAPVDQLSDNSG